MLALSLRMCDKVFDMTRCMRQPLGKKIPSATTQTIYPSYLRLQDMVRCSFVENQLSFRFAILKIVWPENRNETMLQMGILLSKWKKCTIFVHRMQYKKNFTLSQNMLRIFLIVLAKPFAYLILFELTQFGGILEAN